MAVVFFTIWRIAYYNDILPNTFYCKISASRVAWSHGIGYLIDFLRSNGHLYLIACFVIAGCIRGGGTLSLLVYASCFTGCVIFMGGDWMPFHRFLLPILPILLLLAVAGFRRCLQSARPGYRVTLCLCYTALLLAQPLIPKTCAVSRLVQRIEHGLAGVRQVENPARSRLSANHSRSEDWIRSQRKMGEWLREHAPAEAKLAIGAAGVIPYYSRLYTIDFFGRITPEIARSKSRSGWSMPGHERFDLKVILQSKPDFIIFSGSGNKNGEEPVFWLQRFGLSDNPEFRNHYEYRVVQLDGLQHGFYHRKHPKNNPEPSGE